jgi:carbonic anhydrase
MSITDETLEANTQYASNFTHGDLPAPPARHLAVITCMDARLHPEKFLGLDLGEAHIIRNAGGRASDDALRSLIISAHLLGTNEFMVIHHTDCGMLSFSNNELQYHLKEETGEDASHIDFLPFSDLEDSVRNDIQTVRESPFISNDISIRGFIYDVHTGRLQEVSSV